MLLTAIILGLAGSLHCAGMCSPLAFAVINKNGGAVRARVVYNAGRILMYCVLGGVVSGVGVMLPVAVQYALSITLGVIFLIIGITGSNVTIPMRVPILHFTTFLKTLFSKFLQQKKTSSIFVMGALNGLLPCGLTFMALTSCITLSGPVDGFIFMATFGAGTLPVMLGLVSVIPFFAKKLNVRANKLSTALMIVAGCLLIARVLLVEQHSQPIPPGSEPIVICP